MATKEPPSNQTKTRLTLLALLVLFVTPIIFARVAYQQGWLEGARPMHSGHLMVPPVALVELNASLETASFTASEIAETWWLVYIAPPECREACRYALQTMSQAARAINTERTRVRQLLIEPHSREERRHPLLEEQAFSDLRTTTATRQAVDSALRDTIDKTARDATARASEAGYLYLMNPRGNLLMYYPPARDEQHVQREAGKIRDDLLSLL